MQISTSSPLSNQNLNQEEQPLASPSQKKPQRISLKIVDTAISKLRKDFLDMTLPANNFATNDQVNVVESPDFPTLEVTDAGKQIYLSAYSAADAYLDQADLIIVQPKDETKYRAFPKVLSRTDSISPGTPDSSLYVSSPLLKNVGGSSLLRRRVSVTSSPNDRPQALMQLTQNYSIPSKLSPFCAKLHKDSISTNASDEAKADRDLFSSPESSETLNESHNLTFMPSAKCLFTSLAVDATAHPSLDSPLLKKQCS